MGADPWGFDEERQALARRLRDRRLALSASRLGTFLAFFIVLLLGGSTELRTWTSQFAGPRWIQAAGFLAVLYAFGTILALPFAYVSGYRWERKAGLTSRALGSWLRDQGKAAALGFGATILAGEVILWLLAAAEANWWVAAWGLGMAVSFLLAFLAPVVLVPMFYPSRPVSDPAVRARLEDLAAAAGVPVIGVYELESSPKSRRSNAGVMGFGRTRRIVVTDTLRQDYTPEEIDGILAHELGHQKYHDPRTGFVFSAALSLVLAWAVSALYLATYTSYRLVAFDDPASLPVLAFYGSILGSVAGPLELSWSRRRELRADRFALHLTRNSAAFASAIVKLHDKNLGVAHPRPWELWLFYSHPAGRRRVELARSFSSSPRGGAEQPL